MPEETALVPARDLVAQPDAYAHLRAIIAKSKDPRARKAAQVHIDRLTAKSTGPETNAS